MSFDFTNNYDDTQTRHASYNLYTVNFVIIYHIYQVLLTLNTRHNTNNSYL